MRLDLYLAQKYPEVSRATFQKLISSDQIKINGVLAKSSRQDVDENSNIEVNFDSLQPKSFIKENADFAKNIIYEDENVVAINKPAGILTHSKGEINDEFTVADFVRSRLKDPKSFADSNRPGIVHRLDRATSGVLIAAKNPETQKFLQKQFADRKAKKTYLALAEKTPKVSAARIDLPIGRNPKSPSEFRIDAKGKTAVTDYKILETFTDNSALVELRPQTGRTHQLRVHLAHIGAPIIGDAVYGKAKIKDGQIPRMFLHAAELEITIPHEGENQRRTFVANLPGDFQQEIEKRENET